MDGFVYGLLAFVSLLILLLTIAVDVTMAALGPRWRR